MTLKKSSKPEKNAVLPAQNANTPANNPTHKANSDDEHRQHVAKAGRTPSTGHEGRAALHPQKRQ